MILVDRGDCTFVEKLRYVSKAGAAGAIVISDTDEPMNPSSGSSESIGDLASSGLVVLTQSSGRVLMEFVEQAQRQETFVTVSIEPELAGEVQKQYETSLSPEEKEEGHLKTEMRYIYLAGKPILNMIILV
jgi:mannosidase alpha-like ER degradation enhancer 1